MDSEPKTDQEDLIEEVQAGDELKAGGPKIIKSPLKNFSKKEFIVLKHNVFTIQSISPKKMILRIKGINKDLADGVYVIQ